MMWKIWILILCCSVMVLHAYAELNRQEKEFNLVHKKANTMFKTAPSDVTNLSIGIYVNSFYGINTKTMDFSLSYYLRQAWMDARLGYNETEEDIGKKIRVPSEYIDRFWLPDLFLRNDKGSSFQHVTVDNKFMRINSTGHVWYVVKVVGTYSCPMDLTNFPLDSQSCSLKFESFGYTEDVLQFDWLSSPVDVDPEVQLPEYTLTDTITDDCSQNYTAGSFPCLEIEFKLRRDRGNYVVTIYLPTIFVVILSWLGFWVGADAIPARMGVGFFCFLVLIMMNAGARMMLPAVSYATALDVWFFFAFLFVFATFLELAVVRIWTARQAQQEVPAAEKGPKIPGITCTLDKACALFFPIVFLFFIIIYCAAYS